jgi:hypothetical protein
MVEPPVKEIRSDRFYAELPVFDRFARLTDAAIYTAVPQDWVLLLADIVQSTAAIAAGRYKAVNTAAAAVIAAVSNVLGDSAFPFVFGGDGATLALPPDHAQAGADALAAVAAWVRDDLDLDMRVALAPVSAIRMQGYDVRVARFAPSPNVSYAMFSGGGVAYAEAQMKAGAYRIAPAPPGTRPDLTGLSCRFDEIRSSHGVILSLIVVPDSTADPALFVRLIEELLAMIEADGVAAVRPVPPEGPPARWPPAGFELEARALRKQGRSRFMSRLLVGLHTLASYLLFRTGFRVGGFDPGRYLRQLVENTDFRKFDDGLRMTLDCTPELADRIEARLARAAADRVALYGTHRQDAALITCFVPSPVRSDHVHFVDGAMGGYAAAARLVKGDLSPA